MFYWRWFFFLTSHDAGGGIIILFFLVVVRMSVLMRISADRPALKWNEPSGKARARWVRNAHGSVFSCIQVSGSHRHTHTPFYSYRFMCFATHKHTIELQRCTYFFPSVHIHAYLPLYLEVILLPPPALYLHTCPPIPLSYCFLPRYPELCVPVQVSANLSYRHHSALSLMIHTDTPLRTDTDICPCPSATRSLPHHFSLFLKSPSVTISNFHKRHVSFRLVLKGSVFVDSHTSRPLGS